MFASVTALPVGSLPNRAQRAGAAGDVEVTAAIEGGATDTSVVVTLIVNSVNSPAAVMRPNGLRIAKISPE